MEPKKKKVNNPNKFTCSFCETTLRTFQARIKHGVDCSGKLPKPPKVLMNPVLTPQSMVS